MIGALLTVPATILADLAERSGAALRGTSSIPARNKYLYGSCSGSGY